MHDCDRIDAETETRHVDLKLGKQASKLLSDASPLVRMEQV